MGEEWEEGTKYAGGEEEVEEGEEEEEVCSVPRRTVSLSAVPGIRSWHTTQASPVRRWCEELACSSWVLIRGD